jgi:hypothetical protein
MFAPELSVRLAALVIRKLPAPNNPPAVKLRDEPPLNCSPAPDATE